jgi:hypothetical protein
MTEITLADSKVLIKEAFTNWYADNFLVFGKNFPGQERTVFVTYWQKEDATMITNYGPAENNASTTWSNVKVRMGDDEWYDLEEWVSNTEWIKDRGFTPKAIDKHYYDKDKPYINILFDTSTRSFNFHLYVIKQ